MEQNKITLYGVNKVTRQQLKNETHKDRAERFLIELQLYISEGDTHKVFLYSTWIVRNFRYVYNHQYPLERE